MVTSIILPAMLAERTTDLMRGLFLAFAAGSAMNFIVVLNERPVVYEGVFYYQGYFTDKNTLGECASVAFLLALHEMFHSGLRRALGIVIVFISALLVFVSNSKTSFGLAVLKSAFGCTPCAYRKEAAHFPGGRSVARAIFLCRIVQL